jgi:uncharacterized membrane protein
MFHGLSDHTFDATAGCVMFVTGAALAMIVYATLMFIDLLAATPPQALLQLVNY